MSKMVRAAFIRGFDQVVMGLGGNPESVATLAGLALADIEDPNALIPTDQALAVLTLSAQETGCEYFGLELAKQRELDSYLGILGDILKSAPNLGEAFNAIFQLISVHSEVSLWQLKRKGNVAYVSFTLLGGSQGDSRQVEQVVLMLFFRLIGALSAWRWHPTTVSFTFSKPQIHAPYSQAFGAPIVFDASFCGVIFHSSDLAIQLPGHNPTQHANLMLRAQSILNSRPRDFEADIRMLIRKNIDSRQVGEEQITKFYPFEKRTLQRKLKLLGTSYREILSDVRTGEAKRLLIDSNLSVTRISTRLCFSDIANFTKAFKKQTGLSPSAWREMVRSDTSKDITRRAARSG